MPRLREDLEHMKMLVSYCGSMAREKEVTQIFPGVGEMNCVDCDGRGEVDFEPDAGFQKCVACKGTGKLLVSI
jgi:hypothetical protein